MSEQPVGETRLQAGTQVGDYVVQGQLADGGMSTVYSAIHPLIGKRAAIKVISPQLSCDELAIKRFLQEARAVNEIRHPNIVDVFACGHLADGRSYLVMEWLEGETLGDRLWAGRLTLDEGCDILLQMCEALDAAHDKRIVHLDLKPENVFLVPVHGGRTLVKLLDFGIAKLINDHSDKRERAAAFAGTPEYASPEQAQGVQALDGKSDIYSLGVIAYEMFAGRLPFASQNIGDLLLAHVQKAPPAMDLAWTGSSSALEALILRLLDKDPSNRPTLAEIRESLTTIREWTTHVPTQQSIPTVRPRASSIRALALCCVFVALSGGAWARFRGKASAAAVSPTVASAQLAPAFEGAALPTPVTVVATAPKAIQATAPRRIHHRQRAAASAVAATDPVTAAPPSSDDDDYVFDFSGQRR
jgi:serine/threonine protein kinase